MAGLWEHQRKMVDLALRNTAVLWAAQMGTGKTRAALKLIEETEYSRVLVVCPKKAVEVWEFQTSKYGEPNRATLYLGGSEQVKEKAVKLDMFCTAVLPLKMVVVNYDIVHRKVLLGVLSSWKPELIICDESHKIMSYNSSVSKVMWKLGKTAKKRVAMTGTPFPTKPTNIFGQARFLDDRIFGKNWGTFRSQYELLVPMPTNPYVLMTKGTKNEQELAEKIAGFTIFVNSRDVVDLPIETHHIREITLPDAARKQYQELKKNFITWVDSEPLTAKNVLTKLSKLHQLTGGFVIMGETAKEIHRAKLDAVEDILDGIGDKKAVVFANFTAEIVALRDLTQEMNLKACEISGRENGYKFWPKSQVAIVQIQAGAEAIDLSEADYVLYYSKNYSLGNFDQSKARAVRPRPEGEPRKERVIFYHLLVSESVDMVQHQMLIDRKDVNTSLQELINAIKRLKPD